MRPSMLSCGRACLHQANARREIGMSNAFLTVRNGIRKDSAENFRNACRELPKLLCKCGTQQDDMIAE